ncbi:MAG: hypothetical protein R2741_09505 [Methanolobus sp.]
MPRRTKLKYTHSGPWELHQTTWIMYLDGTLDDPVKYVTIMNMGTEGVRT